MARRQWWQTPKLRHDEERASHRPVTWLELFFDLFLVVAVSQLSAQLSEHVSWPGVVEFVMLFLPLFWVWVGITYYQERFETDGLENRLIMFTFMIFVAAMAIFARDGLGHRFAGFVLSYVAARVFTMALWIRAGVHNPLFRPIAWRYTVGFTLGQSCAVASVLAGPGRSRYVLMGLALATDVFTPLSTFSLNRRLPRVSSSKHPERFGLFTLIVLGETVVGVVAGVAAHLARPAPAQAVAALLGIFLGFAFWWVYFDFVGRRPFRHSSPILYAWTYLHFAMFVCIVAAGAGILNAVRTVGERDLPAPERWLVGAAVAGFLLTTAALETLLARRHDEPTHAVWSPALKAAAAPAALAVAATVRDVFALFLALQALVAVQMAYGVWVWFRQHVEPPAAGLERESPD